jgi:hypothetical protein
MSLIPPKTALIMLPLKMNLRTLTPSSPVFPRYPDACSARDLADRRECHSGMDRREGAACG